MKDFYAIMGLQRNATPKQVREKYLFLAKELHPDKPTGNAEAFKALQEAYGVLGDPAKRRAYDLSRKVREFVPPSPSPGVIDLIAWCRAAASGRVSNPIIEQGEAVLARVLEDRGINPRAATAESVFEAMGLLKPKRKKRAS